MRRAGADGWGPRPQDTEEVGDSAICLVPEEEALAARGGAWSAARSADLRPHGASPTRDARAVGPTWGSVQGSEPTFFWGNVARLHCAAGDALQGLKQAGTECRPVTGGPHSSPFTFLLLPSSNDPLANRGVDYSAAGGRGCETSVAPSCLQLRAGRSRERRGRRPRTPEFSFSAS